MCTEYIYSIQETPADLSTDGKTNRTRAKLWETIPDYARQDTNSVLRHRRLLKSHPSRQVAFHSGLKLLALLEYHKRNKTTC